MTDDKIKAAAERWVDEHGDCLHRFALMRVRKPEVAEDLVQETFLAAVRGYGKFVSVGFWNHDQGPKEWKPEADVVMHRAEFWQTMRDCLSKLPQKVRDVFTMREMDDVPSKEICANLAISDSNLWVMLHRARMALRKCLEMNWFETGKG